MRTIDATFRIPSGLFKDAPPNLNTLILVAPISLRLTLFCPPSCLLSSLASPSCQSLYSLLSRVLLVSPILPELRQRTLPLPVLPSFLRRVLERTSTAHCTSARVS